MAARRLFLPLAVSPSPVPRPTVDTMRKRLGGRASTDAGAGEIVSLGGDRTGVVLFVRGDQLDVWLPGDVVRRVRRPDAIAADGVIDRELYAVSSDARSFAALLEGQHVSFEQDGALRSGTLVEKCRFGALVEADASTIVAVGFRRVVALPSQ